MCEEQLECKIDPNKHNQWAIGQRMAGIKHKIFVMSNKGGVGKSTVTVNLGATLAQMGRKVGIADADVHGPNIPKMLGVEGKRLCTGKNGIEPLELSPNLKVASLSFLIERPDEPIAWRDSAKYDFLCELMGTVNWGELDYLIIDLPPGTGNEVISLTELIDNVSGSVIVTTPQDVVLLDVRKAVLFSRDSNVRVIGIIENMSGLSCPHCGENIDVFKTGGGKKIAAELGTTLLGTIPLDPQIAEYCDDGKAFACSSDSKAAKAFKEIVVKCEKFVTENTGPTIKLPFFKEPIPIDPELAKEQGTGTKYYR
jgi:Mrp family chromosome partitioning ATPase